MKPFYFLGLTWSDNDNLVHYGNDNADTEKLFDTFAEARDWIIENTTGYSQDDITPINIVPAKRLT
jgi:hypothetical protein